MTNQQELRPSAAPLPAAPPCPNCNIPARYLTSLFDIKQDRNVLIYKCDRCREEVWK